MHVIRCLFVAFMMDCSTQRSNTISDERVVTAAVDEGPLRERLQNFFAEMNPNQILACAIILI